MELYFVVTQQSGWVTYVYEVEVSPNPPAEAVIFQMEHGSYLDQIIADTWCVPKPAAALVTGVLAALARRHTQ